MLFSVSFRLLFQFVLWNFHLRAFCHLLAVEGFDITLHAFTQIGAADGSERLAPACHNDLCHTCYAVGTCSDARIGIVEEGWAVACREPSGWADGPWAAADGLAAGAGRLAAGFAVLGSDGALDEP